QDRFHVGEEPVVLLVGRLDRGLGGGEPAPLDALDFELDRQPEGIECGTDRVGRDASVDHGPEDHVPADAAEAVEVCTAHGWASRKRKDPRSQIDHGPAMGVYRRAARRTPRPGAGSWYTLVLFGRARLPPSPL